MDPGEYTSQEISKLLLTLPDDGHTASAWRTWSRPRWPGNRLCKWRFTIDSCSPLTQRLQPLTAQVPANQACTGTVAGQDNVCMVRCQNPALAGPFGGVVPVQLAQGAATTAATNGTAADTSANNGTAADTNANTGTASDIADANSQSDDDTTPAQAAAEIREDNQKRRKIRRRASRIERRTAAAVSYRGGVRK